MSDLVFHLVLFAVAGVVMVAAPLLIGRVLRPKNPTPEKDAVYECGEPTIGSSFVQFDLRFYTVALLFIVFDVEVAFFFPWTAMYGNTMQLTDTDLPPDARIELSEKLLNISDTRPEVHGHAIAVLREKGRLQAAASDGSGRSVAQEIHDSINARNDEFREAASRQIAREILLSQTSSGTTEPILSEDEIDKALAPVEGPLADAISNVAFDDNVSDDLPADLAQLIASTDEKSGRADDESVADDIDAAISADGLDLLLAKKQDALFAELAKELGVDKEDIASRYISASDARSLGWLAFADIAVFFGVLMVGFAYVWKRGDLEWVRAVES
jgi:NADH:ubiquinone oxidoreductase subunit 3 (subunit A)